MERSLPAAVPKALVVAGFLAWAAAIVCPGQAFAATLRLSWASDIEADLSGYRLHYGTAPGVLESVVDAGTSTSVAVAGLDRGVTYYFSVTAVDTSGNESAPSVEVQARLAADASAAPIVDAAIELGSQSIYAARSISRYITVRGRNFDVGAIVDLGSDVIASPPTRTPTGDLLVPVTIPADATPGPRPITVLNPDLGIGTSSDLIAIVKSPDSNADCLVDIIDLNLLARSWNEESGEPRYAPSVDLDGDDYVGPEDLTIFVSYFGREFAGCP